MAAVAKVDEARGLATIPALDGLRALAVVLVVLFHSGHLSGGFLGVDLFFVLSGYLITTLLLEEHARTGAIRLGAFWVRRARRLMPALALMIGATLVAVAVLFDVESVGANRNEAIASLLYVSNWWTLHEPAPFLTVFQHTWSLSIEAQFYLVWPIVLAVVLRHGHDRRRAAATVLALAGAGVIAASVLMVLLHGGPDSIARVYFGTDTRAVPILFGAALASLPALGWLRAPLARTGVLGRASLGHVVDVGVVALVVLFLGVASVTDRAGEGLWEGFYAIAICPVLTIVVAAAARTRGAFAAALSLPPVRALGLISYGVYLWHWPVLHLLNSQRLQLSEWPLLGAQATITVAIASASYVFVEQPIRHGRRPFTRA